jgi:hypothetical protein
LRHGPLTASATTGGFDNITGAAGNDTISGGPGFLETGDVIDGAGGTDVMNARLTSGQTTAPTISNVENLFIRSDLAADTTFSMTDVSGAAQVWADRVTDTDGGLDDGLIVSGAGLTTAVTVGVKGGTSTAANRADIDFNFSGVSGTSDTATLALDGAAVDDVNIAGIETLNVATQGDGSSRIDGTLAAAAASSIVFTGAANATIDATDFDDADGYTVNASAFTGKLSITLEDQAATKTSSFVGGSGDDNVSLGNGLDTRDDIDGGAGTDSINVTAAADLTAVTGALLKNFEVFDAAGATGTFDMDFIDGGASSSTIKNAEVTANLGGGVVIDDLVDTGGVTINATTTAALTVNQAGAEAAGSNSDTMTYTLTSPGTTGDLTVASLTTPDVETINIVSNATAGQTTGHTITDMTFAGATTLKFTGDEQLTVNGMTGSTAVTKIDASGMTDSLIIGAAADMVMTGVVLVLGGSAGDTLFIEENVQAATSVVQGNGGADTITIADAGANNEVQVIKIAAQSDTTASAYDEIIGFEAASNAGTDQDLFHISAFGFTGAQAGVVAATAKVTMTGTQAAGNESFTISATNAANFFDDSGVDRGVAFADSGTDTWVFFDVDKNGNWDAATDSVLIVGAVTGDAFAAADFTFI